MSDEYVKEEVQKDSPKPIQKYQTWLHPSGISVEVVGIGMMKVDNYLNGEEWVPSVSYYNYAGENPDRLFTRSEESFRRKFKYPE